MQSFIVHFHPSKSLTEVLLHNNVHPVNTVNHFSTPPGETSTSINVSNRYKKHGNFPHREADNSLVGL
jgi:hypothetical protein